MHITSTFEEVLNLVFLHILLSQTYPDAVKLWTHWYMDTLHRSPADHSRDHTSSYYRRAKKFSVLHPDGSLFFTLEFPPLRAGFSLGQGSQGIC